VALQLGARRETPRPQGHNTAPRPATHAEAPGPRVRSTVPRPPACSEAPPPQARNTAPQPPTHAEAWRPPVRSTVPRPLARSEAPPPRVRNTAPQPPPVRNEASPPRVRHKALPLRPRDPAPRRPQAATHPRHQRPAPSIQACQNRVGSTRAQQPSRAAAPLPEPRSTRPASRAARALAAHQRLSSTRALPLDPKPSPSLWASPASKVSKTSPTRCSPRKPWSL